jgi:Fe-S-cluster containining protein
MNDSMMTGDCNCATAECCRTIPLLIQNMTKEYRAYLRTRGLQEDQGFILIPHNCQHLMNNKCAIHDSPDRPKVCRIFHGQKRIGMMKIYVPPECGYQR